MPTNPKKPTSHHGLCKVPQVFTNCGQCGVILHPKLDHDSPQVPTSIYALRMRKGRVRKTKPSGKCATLSPCNPWSGNLHPKGAPDSGEEQREGCSCPFAHRRSHAKIQGVGGFGHQDSSHCSEAIKGLPETCVKKRHNQHFLFYGTCNLTHPRNTRVPSKKDHNQSSHAAQAVEVHQPDQRVPCHHRRQDDAQTRGHDPRAFRN